MHTCASRVSDLFGSVLGVCSGGFRGGRGGFQRGGFTAMPRGGAWGGAWGGTMGGGGRGGGRGGKPLSDADLDKGMDDYFKD